MGEKMNNIVDSYKKFKTYYLKKLGKILYNSKQPESVEILDRYINNYFNAKFYNIYETVEDGEPFSFEVLEEEYNGLEVELLELYPGLVKQVKELKKVAYFICNLDGIYEKEEELEALIEEEVIKDKYIQIILGHKKDSFIKEFIAMSQKENKILEFELDEFFELTTRDQRNITIVDMTHSIKVLKSYRKTLVNQVYKDKKLYLKKAINILNKIAFKILREKCLGLEDNRRYIVLLESPAIVDGDFAKEIKDIINDKLINKKLGIALSDEVLFTREKIFKNDVRISCFRDMTYVNDIDKKFASVLVLPIEFFIVTSYKTKRETDIINYANTDDRIIIVEEDA